MRKLVVLGAVAAAVLGMTSAARAEVQTYNLAGSSNILHDSVNTCFNIAVALTLRDCSYARTRIPIPANAPAGLKITGGIYTRGSAGDNIGYSPVSGDTAAGRANLPVSGSVSIDDQDTPALTDDEISFNLSIGAGVLNASTGNGDRAVERWDAWNQVMAPTVVNAATDLGGGSIQYRLGAKGIPTPNPLCAAANPADCFPSPNAPATQDPPGFWDNTAWNLPPASRVGIERSPGFGLGGGPNAGGLTTGTFENYSCLDDIADTDCTSSETLFGSSLTIYRNESGPPSADPAIGNCNDTVDNDGDTNIDGADSNCVPTAATQPIPAPPTPLLVSGPGFDNVVLVATTASDGTLTAELYWTREYIIANGPPIYTDPADTYTTNNSYGSGRITIAAVLPPELPVAVDDAITVTENTVTLLNVTGNDTLGDGSPNSIAVVGAGPANGTITTSSPAPGVLTFQYTPDANFSGTDTFDYSLTDTDNDTDTGTVTITVTERSPVAGNFPASSVGGNPSAAINVLNSPTVLGSGLAADHTVTATGVASGGTCVASGATVSFTPTAGFNGAGSCEFQIEDADGQTDTGQLNVSVSGNSGGGGGGGGGPQLPSGGSSLGLLSLGALLAALPLAARRRRTSR